MPHELTHKLGSLFLLTFVQGMPFGLQDKFLPLILRQQGHSYGSVSLMKLLLIPWLCKGLFAPLINNYRTKQWWLIMSLSAMAFCSFSGVFLDNEVLWEIVVLLLLMNIFAATQDVAADAIVLRIASDIELGSANTAQVVAYKTGATFSGGVLVWVNARCGWAFTFFCLGFMYVVSVLFVTMNNIFHEQDSREQSSEKNSYPLGVWSSLHEFHKTPGTRWLIPYLLVSKLGERGTLSNFPLFLLDHGISAEVLMWWNTMAGEFVSTCGSVCGGRLVSNATTTIKHCLMFLALTEFTLVSFFCIVIFNCEPYANIPSLWYNLALLATMILKFSSGAMSTVTCTSMTLCSKLAHPNRQGSHYTKLVALETLGKLILVALFSAFIDQISFLATFLLFTTSSAMKMSYLWKFPLELQRTYVTQKYE